MTDWDHYNDTDGYGKPPTPDTLDDEFGVSDADIKKLGIERQFLSGLTPTTQARKILEEASPMAAMQLVRLAQHSSSDSVRLSASKEILNRTGVEAGDGKNGEGREPWDEVFSKAVSNIEDFVNAQAAKLVEEAKNEANDTPDAPFGSNE